MLKWSRLLGDRALRGGCGLRCRVPVVRRVVRAWGMRGVRGDRVVG
jgi:hypothetical protein